MWCWLLFFFFKQKTAYEMRISDWSSDVCSSDLSLFQRNWHPRAKSASAGRKHHGSRRTASGRRRGSVRSGSSGQQYVERAGRKTGGDRRRQFRNGAGPLPTRLHQQRRIASPPEGGEASQGGKNHIIAFSIACAGSRSLRDERDGKDGIQGKSVDGSVGIGG